MKLPAANALAGLVLVAGLATGCGGGAPADASEQDFCDSFTGIIAALGEGPAEEEADIAEQVSQLKESVGELEDTGTPEGIPDDARAGFEQFTGLVAGLDDDVSEEDLGDLGEDLSSDEEDDLDAFQTYASETCAAPAEGDAEEE